MQALLGTFFLRKLTVLASYMYVHAYNYNVVVMKLSVLVQYVYILSTFTYFTDTSDFILLVIYCTGFAFVILERWYSVQYVFPSYQLSRI